MKLNCDDVRLKFAFTFNLHRYIKAKKAKESLVPSGFSDLEEYVLSFLGGGGDGAGGAAGGSRAGEGQGPTFVHFSAQAEPFESQNNPKPAPVPPDTSSHPLHTL